MDAIPLTTVQDRYQLYRPLAENEIRIFEILPGLEGDVVQCQIKYINLISSTEYNALCIHGGIPNCLKLLSLLMGMIKALL